MNRIAMLASYGGDRGVMSWNRIVQREEGGWMGDRGRGKRMGVVEGNRARVELLDAPDDAVRSSR